MTVYKKQQLILTLGHCWTCIKTDKTVKSMFKTTISTQADRVTNMLRELKWSTLQQRRNRASLVMLDVTQDITNRSISITVILKLSYKIQETKKSL